MYNSKNLDNYYKHTVSEALFFKTNKPTVKAQDNSVPLKLVNQLRIFIAYFYITFIPSL